MSGVDSAEVDWATGNAAIAHGHDVDVGSLKQAVESSSHGTHHSYLVRNDTETEHGKTPNE